MISDRLSSPGLLVRLAAKQRWVTWAAALTCLTALNGCSRTFWRSQADFDSYNLVLQKTRDPRWDLPRVTVEPDPRSRFYDPFDPDCPPLPPDDPAAHVYMHLVNGIPGYKSWHEFGESMSVENPQWLAPFGLETDQGPQRLLAEEREDVPPEEIQDPLVPTFLNMTLPQAIELANIHSREYQTQIENVYLSALLLTFDRFQFQVRYLGTGGNRPGASLDFEAQPSNFSNLGLNSSFGVSQLLPTGGQWAAELANNTLWLFSGPNQTQSASLLSFSLVQPLLNGAGRQVALSNLTQSEREVLYDIRTLARFRKIFFANTVVNGPGGGYLGLLRQEQLVRNQRDNIVSLLVQLERQRAPYDVELQTLNSPLESLPLDLQIPNDLTLKIQHNAETKQLVWRGAMTENDRTRLLDLHQDAAWQQAIRELAFQSQSEIINLDVAQLLTRYAQSENQLRDAERRLLDSTDQYKLQLGLPTDFQITLNNSLLSQFQLIDLRLTELELELTELANEFPKISDVDPSQVELQALASTLQQTTNLIEQDVIGTIKNDFARVADRAPQRLQEIKTEEGRQQFRSNQSRDAMLFEGANEQFTANKSEVEELVARLEAATVPLESRKEAFGTIQNLREKLLQSLAALKAVQVGLRVELIELQPFDYTQEEVVTLAVENRLDLMNTRARVVDTRRDMEVAANRLQAVLDLVAEADVGTSGGNRPFDFRGDRSTYRAGVRFTAPLDQVLVRNAYRTALINFQRARREYMEQEDQVKLDVRTEWRQLVVLRQNFETARQNLRYAAIQFDLAVEEGNLNRAQGGQAGQTVRGNTGINLLNALQSVLTAQNNLIDLWVQYEQNRINIFLDMDIMEVDELGLWRDPVYQIVPTPANPPPSLSEPTDDSITRLEPRRASLNRSASPVEIAGVSQVETSPADRRHRRDSGNLGMVRLAAARRSTDDVEVPVRWTGD